MTFGLFYSYLRDRKGNPSIAVAILTAPNSKTVSFQIAVRNPKDNFNKVHARAAAGGRLALRPLNINMPDVDSKQTDILKAIVKYLIATNYEGAGSKDGIGPVGKDVIAYNDQLYGN